MPRVHQLPVLSTESGMIFHFQPSIHSQFDGLPPGACEEFLCISVHLFMAGNGDQFCVWQKLICIILSVVYCPLLSRMSFCVGCQIFMFYEVTIYNIGNYNKKYDPRPARPIGP